MIEVGRAIRVYSDLNEQIDFLIFIEESDLEVAENVIEMAWEEWWELDEVSQNPIENYISDRLDENGVEYDLYWYCLDSDVTEEFIAIMESFGIA